MATVKQKYAHAEYLFLIQVYRKTHYCVKWFIKSCNILYISKCLFFSFIFSFFCIVFEYILNVSAFGSKTIYTVLLIPLNLITDLIIIIVIIRRRILFNEAENFALVFTTITYFALKLSSDVRFCAPWFSTESLFFRNCLSGCYD